MVNNNICFLANKNIISNFLPQFPNNQYILYNTVYQYHTTFQILDLRPFPATFYSPVVFCITKRNNALNRLITGN